MIRQMSMLPFEQLLEVKEGLVDLLDRIGDDFFPSPGDMGPGGARAWCGSLFLQRKEEAPFSMLGKRYDILYSEDEGRINGMLSLYFRFPPIIINEYDRARKLADIPLDLTDRTIGYVSTFYVDRECRRLGIGTALENAMMDVLKGQGLMHVILKTFTKDSSDFEESRSLPGTRYYRKNGWTEFAELVPDPGRKDPRWFPAMAPERLAQNPGTAWYYKAVI